jgi:hypothetical protein
LFWKYLYNFQPAMRYILAPKKNSAAIQRIISDLKKNGVAFSTCDEISDSGLYKELFDAINKLEEENRTDIENTRKQTDSFSKEGEKSFLKLLLGAHPRFDAGSIWNRFAKQKSLQQIADGYFSMKDTEIRDYNVWHNLPTNGAPRASQLWHRDREDLKILKIFVYFTDVDAGSGPLHYAPGTHIGGKVKTDPEYHDENGVKRSTDEQMNKVVSDKDWITAVAKKGAIIFADTHGYHKGGLVREKDRILYNCMYTSPACQRRDYFTVN